MLELTRKNRIIARLNPTYCGTFYDIMVYTRSLCKPDEELDIWFGNTLIITISIKKIDWYIDGHEIRTINNLLNQQRNNGIINVAVEG